jgi:hypothetical protein
MNQNLTTLVVGVCQETEPGKLSFMMSDNDGFIQRGAWVDDVDAQDFIDKLSVLFPKQAKR